MRSPAAPTLPLVPRALLLPAAVAALLAGCPPAPPPIDPGKDGPDDAGAPIGGAGGAGEYCETIVGFFCPYYLRCGRMAAVDEAQCRALFLEACNARYEPSYVSLEEAGLLELSPEGVEACRAHLENVSCEEQLLDLDGPCASMWTGTQPEGAPCGFDVESFTCAPGTACVLDLSLCGTCERVVDDGQPCTAQGVTCGRDSSCVDGLCVARRRVGEACGPDDRCVLGATCGDAAVCIGPAYVGVGAACDFENRCPYGATCIGGQCRRNVALGESCGDAAPCDSGFCHEDGAGGGTCVALVEQGGACADGAECQTGRCLEGRCATLPGACFPAAAPGTGG